MKSNALKHLFKIQIKQNGICAKRQRYFTNYAWDQLSILLILSRMINFWKLIDDVVDLDVDADDIDDKGDEDVKGFTLQQCPTTTIELSDDEAVDAHEETSSSGLFGLFLQEVILLESFCRSLDMRSRSVALRNTTPGNRRFTKACFVSLLDELSKFIDTFTLYNKYHF